MTQSPNLANTTPRPRNPDKTIGLWLLAGLLGIFVYLLIAINIRISHNHYGDFRHFYWAADAMLRHQDIFQSGTKGYLYPPLIAFLYTPIVRFGFAPAARLILVINSLLVIGGILLVSGEFLERFNIRKTWAMFFGIALLGALLNVDKIRTELQMFQTNATMFFMFALSLRLLDRRPVLAGTPLGFIFNIKYLSIGLLPWLLIRRRWATAISCVVSTVFFAVLPAVMSGWHSNEAALETSYGGLLKMVGIHTPRTEQANVEDIKDLLSCSITSAMARTPLNGGSEKVGLMYAAAIALASLGGMAWIYKRNRMPLLRWPPPSGQTTQPWKAMIGVEFSAIVVATLVFSPQTNTRHLVLVLLVTIPAAALILAPPRGESRTPLIAAMVIMFFGFIFPFGKMFSHVGAAWFNIGGQCWCLLLALFVLVPVSLAAAKHGQRPAPSIAGSA